MHLNLIMLSELLGLYVGPDIFQDLTIIKLLQQLNLHVEVQNLKIVQKKRENAIKNASNVSNQV